MTKKKKTLKGCKQGIKRPGAGFAVHPEFINREKGGFRDHPENRSNGRWSKENSYSYWLNFFKKLSIEEFQEYKKEHSKDMSMAALAAYARIMNSVPKLEEFKEVANRTEGIPKQQIELSSDKDKPLIFKVNLRQVDKDKNEWRGSYWYWSIW